jgi:hypothetical protein
VAFSLVAGVASELRRRLWSFAAIVLGFGYVLYRDLDRTPYDDAYFFARFARSFLAGDGFSWNRADGPVHGITSQLFQLVSLSLVALTPGHVVLGTKVFLALCLALAAWLLVELANGESARYDLSLGVTLLAVGCPLVTTTVHTGMETALAVLVVVLAFRTLLAAPLRGYVVRSAAMTALVYLVRPDAALLPALAFTLLHAKNPRRVGGYLLALALLLGCVLAAFRWYYGTALPLPFYVKTLALGPYDDAVRSLGARDKLVHLVTFVVFAAPLAALSRPLRDARSFALVFSSLAFVLYHAVVTTEIMGYRSRFYVPALVPLALAAARGARQALRASGARRAVWLGAWAMGAAGASATGVVVSSESAPLERIPTAALVAAGALVAWVVFADDGDGGEESGVSGAVLFFLLGTFATLPPRSSSALNDRRFAERSSVEVTTTRGIFDVERCLPGPSVVYHSELGVTGEVLRDARIVDLAGLMSRAVALERTPLDELCLRDRPDAIFLPHKNYVEQNRALLAGACLRGYTRVVNQSASPLYVRSDRAAAFLACAKDVQAYR